MARALALPPTLARLARLARSGFALSIVAVAMGCTAAHVGEPATTASAPGPASHDDAPEVNVTSWTLVYENLSAFHLDGEYLSYASDGEYVAQILARTPTGVQERIYRGHAGDARLPEAFQRELHTGVEGLAFDQLISPPQRTLIPDEFVTALQLSRSRDGDTQTATLRFVLGSADDKLTPAGDELLSLVKATLARLREAPADVTNDNVSAPTPLPMSTAATT